MPIRVITDAATSLPSDVRESGAVQVLGMFINRDGVEYDAAQIDVDAFYDEIDQMVNSIPTSSQPSAAAMEDAFEAAAQAGDSVLGVFISSSQSGTYESAVRAARAVAARISSFSYALIDSTSNSADEGMPLLDGLDAVRAGRSLEHCAQAVLKGIQSTRFIFAPDSLKFLKAGGRIGAAAALLGNLIKITPVLTVRDTVTDTLLKVRTVSKAHLAMLDQMRTDMETCGGLKRVVVHYIGKREPAVAWAKEAVEPLLGHSVDVVPVSPVVGVHVGPALALCYECNRPIRNKITGNVQQYLCMH